MEKKKVEDCFDGSRVYNYWFNEKWCRDSILQLKSLGNLEYFPEFPRPFFRVIGYKGFQIKGVEGEDNCRVIFPKDEREVVKKEFEEMF